MTVENSSGVAATSNRSKRGFTLTEIAIVLGIIGLILGAIWVAAAAVYNNMRLNEANTELLQITQAVRAMYATSQTVDAGANMTVTGTQSGGGLTYLKAGVFPTNSLDTGVPSTATQARNPWNGNISIQSEQENIPDDSFVIDFDGIPSQACIGLLTASTGQGRDPGMYKAGGGTSGGLPTGTTLTAGTPFAPSTAEATCTSAANGNAAAFWFALRAGT